MRRIHHILVRLAITLLFLQGCYGASFFNDHTRGWHWYERFALGEQESEVGGQKDKQPSSSPKSPTELVKVYREELESRLHRAWVYPTPQNLKTYQEMQQDLMNRSKVFATVWMQNVYQHPELDNTLVSPVNQQARHIHIDLEKEQTRKVIQSLSQTYGLFFFFSGDCPYCHQFAPIVKRFAEIYGWEVIAISVDGGSLGEFPNAQANNGLFETWNVKVLPSLFAVNPTSQEAIPIAYGLTALDEMESRLISLLGIRDQVSRIRKNSEIQGLMR